jgi:hypothetical protein
MLAVYIAAGIVGAFILLALLPLIFVFLINFLLVAVPMGCLMTVLHAPQADYPQAAVLAFVMALFLTIYFLKKGNQ